MPKNTPSIATMKYTMGESSLQVKDKGEYEICRDQASQEEAERRDD